MWTAWRNAVGKVLAVENPTVLSDFLRLASGTTGISRSELQRELGLKQPRTSKLSTKLMSENWLQTVPRLKGVGGLELI
jgi:hypothetical protein